MDAASARDSCSFAASRPAIASYERGHAVPRDLNEKIVAELNAIDLSRSNVPQQRRRRTIEGSSGGRRLLGTFRRLLVLSARDWPPMRESACAEIVTLHGKFRTLWSIFRARRECRNRTRLRLARASRRRWNETEDFSVF